MGVKGLKPRSSTLENARVHGREFESRLCGPGSPYELISSPLPKGNGWVYKRAVSCLNDIYRRSISRGDAALATFGETVLTFKLAFAGAASLAAMLRTEMDVTPRSRVILALPNCPEWIVGFLAITSIGATVVMADDADTDEVQRRMRTYACVAAISEHQDSHAAQDARAIGRLTRSDVRLHLTSSSNVPTAFPSLPTDDACVIAFTSGSTGIPKGVILSHRNIVTGLMNMLVAGMLANETDKGLAPGRRTRQRAPSALVHQPLSYIGGLCPFLLALYMGTSITVLDGWDSEAVLCMLERRLITSIPSAEPAHLHSIAHRCDSPGSLQFVGLNGSAVHANGLREIARIWPSVVLGSGYGMTETSGTVSAITGPAIHADPGAAGRIVPAVEIYIGDDPNSPCHGIGESEIWLKGASIATGSLESSELPTRSGWFRTGDIGYLSDERTLHVVDRLSSFAKFFNSGVSAAGLERIIMRQFPILEIAVILRKESESCRPRVAVAIVPQRDVPTDEKSMHRLIQSSLPEVACDIRSFVYTTLPKTQSGKIDRELLSRFMMDSWCND